MVSDQEESPLSYEQRELLEIANIVTTAMSLVGSVFIFTSLLFLTWRSRSTGIAGLLGNLHYKLVFMVSCSDIIHSVAKLLGDPEDKSTQCYVQAILSQFSLISSIGWVLAIAVTLWGMFVVSWPVGEPSFDNRLFVRSGVCVFSVALIFTLIPLWGDHYGDSGGWCWIDASNTGQLMRLSVLYVPLWICVVAICIMYNQIVTRLSTMARLGAPNAVAANEAAECCECFSSIVLVLRGDKTRRDDLHFSSMLRVIRRLSMYPLVLIVCWTFATVTLPRAVR